MKDILVVDDVEIMREVLKDLLIGEGYTVESCSGPQEALQALEKEQFKVVLTDLQMPKLTGAKLCVKMRKHNLVTYFIAMTGFFDDFGIADCRQAGFDDYIVKPYKKQEILKRVEIGLYKVNNWLSLEVDCEKI